MNNRVAITGLGCLTGLGNDVDSTWVNLIAGKSGISHYEGPADADKMAIKIAGAVKGYKISETLLEEKEASRYDRFLHFSLSAADEALKDSGVLESNAYEATKIGAILGVGMGGFPMVENFAEVFTNKGARRVSPFFIPGIIPNMASGLISIQWGFKGLNYTVSSACASACHALTSACYEIMSGRQDMMISGGAESVISNLPISGFANMKALSKRNHEPQKASRPFDTERDGFVMGEGAGILILENLEKAKNRGAKIYAEIIGHGANSDANHITAPHPEGEGASACMSMALNFAGLKPEQIGYVNAHGTSTPLGDIAETKAVKKTFGGHAHKLCVSSTKSMVGHLLGAAGGIETLFCAKAMHEGILPPTANLENQDPECDLDYIPNEARKLEVEYMLNNSFGFGGTNSSIILKRYS